MTREEIILFWEIQLKNKILLSPSMEFIIKETIKYLEEVEDGTN